jgi:hypothetical protein
LRQHTPPHRSGHADDGATGSFLTRFHPAFPASSSPTLVRATPTPLGYPPPRRYRARSEAQSVATPREGHCAGTPGVRRHETENDGWILSGVFVIRGSSAALFVVSSENLLFVSHRPNTSATPRCPRVVAPACLRSRRRRCRRRRRSGRRVRVGHVRVGVSKPRLMLRAKIKCPRFPRGGDARFVIHQTPPQHALLLVPNNPEVMPKPAWPRRLQT